MTAPAKAAPMREDVTQVIQADRDAAAMLHRDNAGSPTGAIQMVNGDLDDEPDVQAFASHRLAHTARPDAGDEDVERVACAIYNEDSLDGLGESTKSVMMDRARAALAAMREGVDRGMVERAGQFLLDRLVDHEVRMTSDGDAREWYGHVTPAMARFRAALSPEQPR